MTEDLDAGNILYRSWAHTHRDFLNASINKYYWKTAAFIPREIERLISLGPEMYFKEVNSKNSHPEFYSNKLYKKPKNLEFISGMVRKWFKLGMYFIGRIIEKEQWFLLYRFDPKGRLSTIGYQFKPINPPKDRYWADPCVIFQDGKYFIFFEDFFYKENAGQISMLTISKDGSFSEPVCVLKRPYHLSYPFVFKHNGQYYMIPETQNNMTIELYKSINFPGEWSFVMNLMENVWACDTTIFEKDGRVWMFTCMKEFEGDKDTDDWFVKYIFSLITLLLGAAIPLIWEHFASRNRLKKVGKRWTAEIKFLEVPIKEQIEVLDEFLIRHATSDYEIPQLYLLEGLNGEKFASMDKGELLTFIQKFKTPDTNKATSDSNRVNGFISIVKSTDAALKEKFEEYMTRTSTLNAEFSKNLTRLSRAFGDYSVALEKQYNSDAFMNDRLYKPMYELFAKQIHPFVQTGGLTLQHVSTNFLPYLFPLLANARLDPRTAEMTLYLSNCMEALTQISMERGYFQQNAETIKERLKTYLAEIDEIVSLVELKKLPV